MGKGEAGRSLGRRLKTVLRIGLTVILLMLLMLNTVGTPVLAAEGDETDSSAESIRSLEQGIVDWKIQEQGEDALLTGDLLDNAGEAGSDWIAFDLARMGLEQENYASYLSRLRDQVEKIYQDMDDSLKRYRVSDMHRIVLTVAACGGDPTCFGTDPEGNPIDLVNDTVWNSKWGDPGDQGINGYIWALLAADCKQFEEPADAQWTREKLIAEILSRQLADGGFGLVTTDPSDVDLTSMALTALAPYAGTDKEYTVINIVTEQETTLSVDQVAEQAFACLQGLEQEDGTMITYDERTSESTAWAMLALASWGRDPETDEPFVKNGKSLVDGLKEFRLADGGIIHSLDGDEEETEGNNMAGYQAVYGLEAVYRLKTQKNRVFDLRDSITVSEQEIDEAAASLPALSEKEEKTAEEVQEDVSNRTLYLVIGIAVAVVLVVGVFLTLLLKERKKKDLSQNTKGGAQIDEEDDDDW